MGTLDYVVLVGYFGVMIAIGVISMLKVKAQEDFFMGGRSFGKLLQTFAAFGAGTGSSDPVNAGRTAFTGGMSGMWSVMYWLFVTPFYWITGVWYRRMRHLTLGDWFVERYESRNIGAAYCIFGLLFFMVYGSMMFSAIGKVAAPLIEIDSFMFNGEVYGIEYLLVPVIGVVVLVYGIAGGLRAAYYTDLVQGLAIILLSIILIPYGLSRLVQEFGDPNTQGMWHGFRIMHEQLPREYFNIVGSSASSEFPLHRIIAVVIINLIGIVVQPHFIATGGGSAKTETNARVGLVVGNFLKRFCTIGWVLTAMIAVALFADSRELVEDPDKTWGVASRELLGPGLTGLMLACLLAALMSSIDAYMIVGSALVVRNLYAPYINKNATEREYVRVGRMTGVIVVAGAVLVSLFMMNVFEQLQLTWVFPVLFAAPFWIGMYWRRATTAAAWVTVAFCASMFFLVPALAPWLMPDLRTDERFLNTTELVRSTVQREAAPSDREKREAAIALWDAANSRLSAQLQESWQTLESLRLPEDAAQAPSASVLKQYRRALDRAATAKAALEKLGPRPEPIAVGDTFTETFTRGGEGIFWPGGVKPIDEDGNVLDDVQPQQVGEAREVGPGTTEVTLRYPEGTRLKGFGNFKLDFLIYKGFGMDLSSKNDATIGSLELVPKIILPFVVMILVSLVTPRNSKEALDRYYAKMKTQVDPDPQLDRANLEAAYADPEQFERRKLFPGTSFEFQKPRAFDVIGFIVCFAVCFAIIGLAFWVATIGA